MTQLDLFQPPERPARGAYRRVCVSCGYRSPWYSPQHPAPNHTRCPHCQAGERP